MPVCPWRRFLIADLVQMASEPSQGHKKAELPTQPYKYKPLCGVPYNGRITIRPPVILHRLCL